VKNNERTAAVTVNTFMYNCRELSRRRRRPEVTVQTKWNLIDCVRNVGGVMNVKM